MNGKMNGWSLGLRDHVEEMGPKNIMALFAEVDAACERWLRENEPGYLKWRERMQFNKSFLHPDEGRGEE